MRLSSLQKYILLNSFGKKGFLVSKKNLAKFYDNQKNKPKTEDISGIITKSVERLIDRELMTGYGVRTPHKWFIKEVRLTAKGRKTARELQGKQQQLPFNKKKIINK